MTGKKAGRQKYGYCQRSVSDSVLQEAGKKLFQTYIERRQAKVEEWVDLRPILKV